MDLDFSGVDYVKIKGAIDKQIFSPQEIAPNAMLGTSSSATKLTGIKITAEEKTEEKTVEILLDTGEIVLIEILEENGYHGNCFYFDKNFIRIQDKYGSYHYINDKKYVRMSVLTDEGKMNKLQNELEKKDKNDQ